MKSKNLHPVNPVLLKLASVEQPDATSRAVTVCVRSKRALRFSDVQNYQQLANTIRTRCGISASPQHSASSQVKRFRCLNVSIKDCFVRASCDPVVTHRGSLF